jgi:HlyD family secretion protein
VLSVPIQAMTVREAIVDQEGNIVRPTPAPGSSPSSSSRPAVPAEPKEGQTRKELEGAFLVKDGHTVFTPVKVGIAGDKYFEVLSGLADGDEVIIGPPTVARSLREGDAVKVVAAPSPVPGGPVK